MWQSLSKIRWRGWPSGSRQGTRCDIWKHQNISLKWLILKGAYRFFRATFKHWHSHTTAATRLWKETPTEWSWQFLPRCFFGGFVVFAGHLHVIRCGKDHYRHRGRRCWVAVVDSIKNEFGAWRVRVDPLVVGLTRIFLPPNIFPRRSIFVMAMIHLFIFLRVSRLLIEHEA